MIEHTNFSKSLKLACDANHYRRLADGARACLRNAKTPAESEFYQGLIDLDNKKIERIELKRAIIDCRPNRFDKYKPVYLQDERVDS
jgi:hypothetical protein